MRDSATSMDVAVIILNYNSSADCQKCIESLAGQEGVTLEIVVVDNCSRPEQRSAVEALCQQTGATFIAAADNRGYNAGNNIGLRYAVTKGYKYALIANPDMEFPQRDFIKRLVDKMEEDDDIVVCGGDIVGLDGKHQNPMKGLGHWLTSFGWIPDMLGLYRNADTYRFIDNYAESHYCVKVSGCCLLVRLDFVESIGYFDEGVFLYCEETILSQQVRHAARKMYYLAEAQAVHAHHNSTGANKLRQMRTLRDSRLYMIRHHSGYGAIGYTVANFSERLQHLLFATAYRFKK